MKFWILSLIALVLSLPLAAQDIDTVFYDNGNTKFIGGYNAENKPHGKWTTFYENGQVNREGKYRNGHPNGLWTEYYASGQVKSKLSFLMSGKESVKNGKYESFHENGKLAVTGYYSYGRKIGKWKRFDEEGVLIPEEEKEK